MSRISDFGKALWAAHRSDIDPIYMRGYLLTENSNEWVLMAEDLVSEGVERGFLSDAELAEAHELCLAGELGRKPYNNQYYRKLLGLLPTL